MYCTDIMDTQPQSRSNSHRAVAFRLGQQPNLSFQVAQKNSYNRKLFQERDLARYRTVYSSKLHHFDQARVVQPSNRFGIKHIRNVDPYVRYSPAGMDMRNSTRQSGVSFTRPSRVRYAQNVGFALSG